MRDRGLVATLATGMKDIPRNASWLLGKAMPVGNGTNGSSHARQRGVPCVVDSVKQVGWTLKGALPGQDSVEARLARARAASEHAHEEEQVALEAAQRAHDLAAEADDVRSREQARIKEVKAEQGRLVKERVAAARKRADEQVAQEKSEARVGCR